jgi:hypothetical protein
LLADSRFILKPDFDRPAGKLLRDCVTRQLGKVWDCQESCVRGRLDIYA